MILTALVACSVCGCVPFPIAVPESKPFKQVVSEFFIIGETTASDVNLRLGEPAMAQADWWLYRDTRNGWQWAFCYGAGYSGGCDSFPRSNNDYFLLVHFSDDTTVRTATLYSEDQLCEERQLCFEGPVLMRPASKSADEEAKQFQAPRLGCAVYTYSTTSTDSAAGELIVDGQPAEGLVGKAGFHRHTVVPGKHAWVVVPARDKALPLSIARKRIECEGQQVLFLRYHDGLWSQKLKLVDSIEGQKEIRKRWLAASNLLNDERIRSNWLRDDEVFVRQHGKLVAAYQIVQGEKVPRWGATTAGEPCGTRAALEDYRLSPVGEDTELAFAESLTSPVQLRSVCSEDKVCDFASVIDGEVCEADRSESIFFDQHAKLLVIESTGSAYVELFHGKAWSLRKLAECEGNTCQLDVVELRKLRDAK